MSKIGQTVVFDESEPFPAILKKIEAAVALEQTLHDPQPTISIIANPTDLRESHQLARCDIHRFKPPYGPERGTMWVLRAADWSCGLALMAG